MASSKEFKDYLLEQFKKIGNITYKSMMGEFLLYYNGILFGGIYDDRLLIKITSSNEFFSLKKHIPYLNAKPMYLVDNIDDVEYIKKIIITTFNDLIKNKKGL